MNAEYPSPQKTSYITEDIGVPEIERPKLTRLYGQQEIVADVYQPFPMTVGVFTFSTQCNIPPPVSL